MEDEEKELIIPDEFLKPKVKKELNTKKRKYEHLPILPETFLEFRELKHLMKARSDNAAVVELMRWYQYLLCKQREAEEEANNNTESVTT
jgi:hypothetical protein